MYQIRYLHGTGIIRCNFNDRSKAIAAFVAMLQRDEVILNFEEIN